MALALSNSVSDARGADLAACCNGARSIPLRFLVSLSISLFSPILAGSDTIATAVAGCLYLLLQHPDTLARLRQELEAEFRSDADITMARLAGLPYIRAVVDEALRIYPPISGELRRAVPTGVAVVCGHFIPGDTIISVYAFASCDNASNFAQPKRFTPERCLTTDERTEWTRNDHLEASQPFSVGPRNGIGMGLAYAETKLILARLLFRYDLELLDDKVQH